MAPTHDQLSEHGLSPGEPQDQPPGPSPDLANTLANTEHPDGSGPSQSTTLFYPIRSLLSEVRPSSSSHQNQPRHSTNPHHHSRHHSRRKGHSSFRDAHGAPSSSDREIPTIQQRRTAEWQQSMMLTELPTPGNMTSTNSNPLSGETTVQPGTSHYFSGDSGASESSGLASSPHTAPLVLPEDASIEDLDISEQADAQWAEEARLRQLAIEHSRPHPPPHNDSTGSNTSERANRLAKGGFVDLGPPLTEAEYEENRSSISGSRGNRRGPFGKQRRPSITSDFPSDMQHPKTVRFRHVETDNGHFVITGREGQLERCEDEPIHIPGAVQGFGVLIALEEDVEAGVLVVRQVSENSTEILGLSPAYLFSLQCFSHVLPRSQANVLWDNVQYLPEMLQNQPLTGAEEENPQVFMLSGYGEPGSADPAFNDTSAAARRPGPNPQSGGESGTSSGEVSSLESIIDSGTGTWTGPSSAQAPAPKRTSERREWTCWCAAHRARLADPPSRSPSSVPSGPTAGSSDLVASPSPEARPPNKAQKSFPLVGPDPSKPPLLDKNNDPSTGEGGSFIILEFEVENDLANPLYPPVAPIVGEADVTVVSNADTRRTPPLLSSSKSNSRSPDATRRRTVAPTSASKITADESSGPPPPRTALDSAPDDVTRPNAQIVGSSGSDLRPNQPHPVQPPPTHHHHHHHRPHHGLRHLDTESSTAGSSGTATVMQFNADSVQGRETDTMSTISTVITQPATISSGQSTTAHGPAVGDSLSTSTPPTTAPTLTLRTPPPVISDEEAEAGAEAEGPSLEDVLASTTNRAQPIRALERMRQLERLAAQRAATRPHAPQRGSGSGSGRRSRPRGYNTGTLDVFAVLAQINEQLSVAGDIKTLLDVTVGIMKDLTQFHRVLIYQFDDAANGEASMVVAELVDRTQSVDIYRGLHFPAGDIPPQARHLYKINKVRSLYDRDKSTARLVGRTKRDVEMPVDLTHSYLRAMSPIHIKYLANMRVRSSMSISIVLFGKLWGLICCHSYGSHGMRVTFPVRQMLRLLSDSVSHNIERLSYTHRLQTRKLINTIPSANHPNGHIVSSAEDLLDLFDADYGVLVIGDGAKILGPSDSGQDILVITEYLRVKQFPTVQTTTDLLTSYPDIVSDAGPRFITGMLLVPLSPGGRDFMVFLRKGQRHEVKWAGRPHQDGAKSLEPRSSFKAWSEIVASKSRPWTEEQLDTSNVLSLVYGKFIDVWRQKENAMRATQLTNLLLSNASHEVRTPLNHIINYLELAMNGPLDRETRENLSMSHAASKNLLFTINDLLDLTKLETGKQVAIREPFDVRTLLSDAVAVYKVAAERQSIGFELVTSHLPQLLLGDAKKVRQVVANLTANAVKYTTKGSVRVEAREYRGAEPPQDNRTILVEIVIADTGCGIESSKLQRMFREFEQIDHLTENEEDPPQFGVGLAVVAHVIKQLGGQLRVDSKPGLGSRFTFILPFGDPATERALSRTASRTLSLSSKSDHNRSQVDDFIEAMTKPSRQRHKKAQSQSREKLPDFQPSPNSQEPGSIDTHTPTPDPTDARHVRSTPSLTELPPLPQPSPNEDALLVSSSSSDLLAMTSSGERTVATIAGHSASPPLGLPSTKVGQMKQRKREPPDVVPLRLLIVEDDLINRTVLEKRLKMRGHEVLCVTNGQEAVDLIERDRAFDCIFMDIQMPILDGFEAAARIREIEQAHPLPDEGARTSLRLNQRIPIIAVSASLRESQRAFMLDKGMDAWILKPIDFERLRTLKQGITDMTQRRRDLYVPGCSWEKGGWMRSPSEEALEKEGV